MSKYYFREDDDENCYQKASIIEQMKIDGITELSVVEAKRKTAMGYFYCQKYSEVGEVGESCGKQCGGYKPRNGKNGRCVYSGNCYSPTENKRTFKIKEESK